MEGLRRITFSFEADMEISYLPDVPEPDDFVTRPPRFTPTLEAPQRTARAFRLGRPLRRHDAFRGVPGCNPPKLSTDG
jgi:hypothetical protein